MRQLGDLILRTCITMTYALYEAHGHLTSHTSSHALVLRNTRFPSGFRLLTPLIGGHGAVLVQDRTHRRHFNTIPRRIVVAGAGPFCRQARPQYPGGTPIPPALTLDL